ncbi:chromosome partitioning ATPase ParA family protein (plasmid) [Nostoc sp. HK-01]|nr:chromosome partitioning ATPase ParA family protein [Nostoc sp. HK-01]
MTAIIALFNQSGGVGKTTLTMNLGYHLAMLKKRVLLVDIDPQASLTTFMGLKPFELEHTIRDALISQQDLPLYRQIHDVDLVPSNIFLSEAEMQLVTEFRREYRLLDALEPVKNLYDFILLDCPPSLGLLSIMCLVAATQLLIPIQTEYKAVEGTMFLLKTISDLVKKVNRDIQVLGAVPTMYDERTVQGKNALQAIQAIFEQLKVHKNFQNSQVYPAIARRTDFANASAAHQPLAVFSPGNSALNILNQIAKQLDSSNDN